MDKTKSYPNYGAPWTQEANCQLISLFLDGNDLETICKETGRNPNAAVSQLVRLELVTNISGKVFKIQQPWARVNNDTIIKSRRGRK